MNISPWCLRLSFLTLCYFTFNFTSWGQSYKLDSLVNQYKSQAASYYIKPIFGLHWSHMTKQGDEGFEDAYTSDLRNLRYGLTVGYHKRRVTLESGITTLPIYTGFKFMVDPSLIVGHAVKVTFLQFPLTIQYTIWRPTKRLELNALAHLAFNTELGKNLLSPTLQGTFFRTNPDGSQTTIRSTVTTVHPKSFFSSALGATLNYHLADRFDVNVQASRLFSRNDIVTQTAQLEQDNNTSTYNIATKVGAGGLSVLLGVTYRFKTTKTYRLRK